MSYHGKHSQKAAIAHHWAHQQSTSESNKPHNFFFEGKTIYSYGHHFPIASLAGPNNEYVAFTSRGYSMATSGHKNYVRSAISHKKIIECQNPDEAVRGSHVRNIEAFEYQAKEAARQLAKAKKPEKYLLEIASIRQNLQQYCEVFKVKKSELKGLKYIWIESVDTATKATEQERRAIAKAHKEQEERQKKEFEEQRVKDLSNLLLWRKFKPTTTSFGRPLLRPFFQSFDNQAFIRYNKVTNNIETTKGIELPIAVAKRFYDFINRVIAAGGCNDQTPCNYKILDYNVEYVNATEFKVGCHTITMQEIKPIAKLLKWIK